MSKQTKHFLISGRVQGVGFRVFAYREALALGIKGWIRNLQDGRVEALVEGDEETLVRFHQALQKGPRMAEVEVLNCNPVPSAELSDFAIQRDGVNPWFKN